MLIPILGLLVILMAGLAVLLVFINKPRKEVKSLIEDNPAGRPAKPKDVVLQEAAKRLQKNPHDIPALLSCGEIYFKNEEWDKAFRVYETLCSMVGKPGIKDFEVNYRCAFAAEKAGNLNEAYKAYVVAVTFNDKDFMAHYGLGSVEFKRGNYEKAVTHLVKSRGFNPEYAPSLTTLGHSYFKLKKYKEAMINIRQALEISPGDKEALITLAECYFEAGQSEQALRIYSHLRADPNYGPRACLKSGEAHMLSNHMDEAIADFEIGLKHNKIDFETEVELKYKIGTAAIKKNDIAKAVEYLNFVLADKPDGYKDAGGLLAQYAELNTNHNLQVYIMSQPAEFLALCRKIVLTFYSHSRVKITNTNVEGKDWADITAEIDTAKWSDIIGFRFVRAQGAIGEFVVRDFHAHLKDLKAGKGICFGIGAFSEEAKRYTEARLIELVEKNRLTAILANVDKLAKELMDSAKKN